MLNFGSAIAAESKKPPEQTPQKPPAPPRRIPPNKVQPGGGLDSTRPTCGSENGSLTALIPVASPVLTVDSHPTFLVYIPDAAAAIDYGEFSLLSADEKTRIYQTRLSLEQTPGIVSISLPESAAYALETNRLYHWYFKLHCQQSADSPVYLDVNGWIQKVDATPARKMQIENAAPTIWYDAIAEVANELKLAPEDSALKQQWFDLLQSVNLENLTPAPILEIPDQSSIIPSVIDREKKDNRSLSQPATD